ncbi:hypothetical protein AAG570_006452 [Ranatra chinensis]|uniref:Uncharacterized protein n=1 Tax=Ranatra chinensis TaxID=642074 RepID=A0ABD0ZB36_9HEMI
MFLISASIFLERTGKMGVCESLDAREASLEDLQQCAEELKEKCSPTVVSQLEEEVEAALEEWHQVSSNLTSLCSKYERAATLWHNYREASRHVQQWIDSSSKLPPDSLDIGALQDEFEAQKRALGELEKLAGEISARVDAPLVLEAELRQLGESLKQAQETLAQLQPSCQQQLQQKKLLAQQTAAANQHIAAVQQSLSHDHEGNLTEKLVALRDHLVDLGKTEADIHSVKLSTDQLSSYAKHEINIVDTLKLWQQVFRETFQEYHRLSAKLVASGDAAAVLTLWHDYLIHVNNFLESSIPDQYHLLNEHQHLCQVHHNVLSCQEALLNKRGSIQTLPQEEEKGAYSQEYSTVSQMDTCFVEQFNSLTNLHNETLAKIMDRQTQDMLDKMREGEDQEKLLHNQLTKLVVMCEDNALSNSLRMEHAAIAHRISNLRAALQTWKGYLIRVNDYIEVYENQVNKIQKALTDVHNDLNPYKLSDKADSPVSTPLAPCLMPHSILIEQLDKMKSVNKRLANLDPELETLIETKERLKESLSPSDMKAVAQRVWLLQQQHADLEHQLTMASQSIEQRLQLANMYDKRQARFMAWVDGLEDKLSRLANGLLEAGDVLNRLETELAADVSLKRREMDWLTMTGAELMAAEQGHSSERANHLSTSLARVSEAWRKILSATDIRAAKLRSIIQGLSQLEARMEELREWLHKIDSKLLVPISLDTANKQDMDNRLSVHEELQKEIEMKSSEIGDVLNLCEILLNDCDSCDIRLNTDGITLAMNNLEKRWKAVCVTSAERKLALVSLWALIQQIVGLTKELEEWLKEQERKIDSIIKRLEVSLHDQLPQIFQDAQNAELDLRIGGGQNVTLLEELYSKFSRSGSSGEVALNARSVLGWWYEVKQKAADAEATARRQLDLLASFRSSHARALEILTRVDALLTMAELIHSPDEAQEQVKAKTAQATASEPSRPRSIFRRCRCSAIVLCSCSTVPCDRGCPGVVKVPGNPTVPKKLKSPVHISAAVLFVSWCANAKRVNQSTIVSTRNPTQNMTSASSRRGKIEKEMDRNTENDVFREADVFGLELISISLPEDVVKIQTMIDEYQNLWQSITTRLDQLKEKKFVVNENETKMMKNQSVEVSTLKFEADKSTQVNTLPPAATPLMRKDAYMLELKKTCQELHSLLDKLEYEESKSHHEMSKSLGRCLSTVELVRHLSDMLIEQCSATSEDAMAEDVERLTTRFNHLYKQVQLKEETLRQSSTSGRLTCPLCSRRNWKQLDNDLWRLEQWLQHAQATMATHPSTPPSNIEQLEDLIQDHRELLLDLDSHRSLVVSLNIVGSHLAEHSDDEDRASELRCRLEAANTRWEAVCSSATSYHNILQVALMQNEEFHDTMTELLDWLERTEIVIRQSEPVDVAEPTHVIKAKYEKFKHKGTLIAFESVGSQAVPHDPISPTIKWNGRALAQNPQGSVDRSRSLKQLDPTSPDSPPGSPHGLANRLRHQSPPTPLWTKHRPAWRILHHASGTGRYGWLCGISQATNGPNPPSRTRLGKSQALRAQTVGHRVTRVPPL